LSKNTRWVLAILGVAVIVVAAVVIGTGRDTTDATPDEQPSTEATAPAGPTGSAVRPTGVTGPTRSGGASAGSGAASPDEGSGGASVHEQTGAASPGEAVVSPVLTAERPRTVTVTKGELVTVRGRSDQPAELHVHGYNKMVELKPGRVGSVTFRATVDGEFSIEFHYAASQASGGSLRVNP
jgi:hypothetical protein